MRPYTMMIRGCRAWSSDGRLLCLFLMQKKKQRKQESEQPEREVRGRRGVWQPVAKPIQSVRCLSMRGGGAVSAVAGG